MTQRLNGMLAMSEHARVQAEQERFHIESARGGYERPETILNGSEYPCIDCRMKKYCRNTRIDKRSECQAWVKWMKENYDDRA